MTIQDVKWTDVAGLVVALGGLFALFVQLRGVTRSIQAETLSHLYDHYHNVMSVFQEKPQLRRYIFGSEILSVPDPDARAELDTVCELVAALFEHAWVQHANVPEAPWQECWFHWMRKSLAKSVELRRFLGDNRAMYVKGFVDDVLKELSEDQINSRV
jgi:hypothetical protein